ncbi:sporulation protein [Haloarcula sp. S1CR25-12]|uniref:Sporulation protein n=1 Tax=Haloarcula saliterrae TaxID=2950534 RepID=A0ABU2F7D7_9EURY|nr:sporulation protein [Haloarcula sp. S1CR25-12]MDS0258159.1 sporulation protein [Haloarcula sp. S1CR25-12]
MFDNVLASVRIGAAEVDTLLETDTVRPGETLPVRVVVDGGKVDQDIEAIELELETRRERDEATDEYDISTHRVTGPFTIEAGEREVFESEIPIHHETPVTTLDAKTNRAKVWIDTDLEIDRAIDADDTDYLQVAPTEPMAAMLEAVERAGHRLSKVTVDTDTIATKDAQAQLPVDQEIEFKPTGSRSYSELELHFIPREEVTHVLLEFDHSIGSENFESMQVYHDDYSVDELRRAFERFA